MNEKDIEDLFVSLLEHPDQDSKAVRDVFSILVKTTLEYRDNTLSNTGVTVTVDDVRTSLDWLLIALKGGSIPKPENKTRLKLVEIWLEKLQGVAGTVA